MQARVLRVGAPPGLTGRSRVPHACGPMVRAVLHAYRDAFSGLPKQVWWLALVTFVNRCGTMVMPFLVLFLTKERGVEPSIAGAAMGMWGVGAVGGSLLGGWLCDRIPPTRVQVLSLSATACGFLSLLVVHNVVGIFVVLGLTSLLADALRPASIAAVARYSPEEARPRAFALWRLAANLGMAVGPATGGFLASVGYEWLFAVDAMGCAAAACLVLVGFPKVAGASAASKPAGGAQSPWLDAWFMQVFFTSICVGIAFLQFMSTLPLFLRGDLGWSERDIGFIFAINTLTIVVCEMLLVRRLERVPSTLVTAAGALAIGLGFGLLAFGSGTPWVMLTVLVWTLGEMLYFPRVMQLVTTRAGERNRGRYLGAYTMAYSLSYIAAPIVGTGLYETWGAQTLWLACIPVGVITAASYALLGKAPNPVEATASVQS